MTSRVTHFEIYAEEPEEILEVQKMAAILSLHSMSLGAPILIEEAKTAGKQIQPPNVGQPATPAVDKMGAIGQWNQDWDPFHGLDPIWTGEFIASGTGFYTNGVLTPKFLELISNRVRCFDHPCV